MSAQDERAPRAAARTGAASRLPIDPAPLAVPERLRDAYVRWARFLNDEVTFGLDDDGLHTKRHCARVLLLCLLIAEREGLSADEAETLCACAVFHDSRRNDDGLDVGHGARAAAYYRDLSAEAGWAFRPTSYAIMAYHDRDDALGEDEVSKSAAMSAETAHGLAPLPPERAVLLYRAFKDADALDRFRLGDAGFDERYLRTEAARALCDDVRKSWRQHRARKSTAAENVLVVVDVQNDFVTGSLGTAEAQAMLPGLVEKACAFAGEVYFTQDTHGGDYLEMQEGEKLPVLHCIEGTPGWEFPAELDEVRCLRDAKVFRKPTFGSMELAMELACRFAAGEVASVEFVGLCTDICVVSNALLVKALAPELPLAVDAACCAGTTPGRHVAALNVLRSCQVDVKEGWR